MQNCCVQPSPMEKLGFQVTSPEMDSIVSKKITSHGDACGGWWCTRGSPPRPCGSCLSPPLSPIVMRLGRSWSSFAALAVAAKERAWLRRSLFKVRDDLCPVDLLQSFNPDLSSRNSFHLSTSLNPHRLFIIHYHTTSIHKSDTYLGRT
jgi:hypothetical protein